MQARDLHPSLGEFLASDFDAAAYTRGLFENQTEQQVRIHVEDLTKRTKKAKAELRETVHRNYQLFIDSAREIGSLESDLTQLRIILGEMTSVVKTLGDARPEIPAVADSLQSIAKLELEQRGEVPSAKRPLSQRFDDLDMLITERHFDSAVTALVGIEAEVTAQQQEQQLDMPLGPEAEERSAAAAKATASAVRQVAVRRKRLLDLLVNDLQNANLKRDDSRRIIATMTQLGCASQARYVFLGTRSAWIRKQIRRLKFQGDIALYIGELAHLMFLSIKVTHEDFSSLFPDKLLLSGFVKWVTQELDFFSDMFSRQVLTVDDFQTLAACLNMCAQEMAILRDVGLEMGFYLTRSFEPGLQTAIMAHFSRVETTISNALYAETWTSIRVDPARVFEVAEDASAPAKAGTAFLTDSAIELYRQLRIFVEGVAIVFSHELYNTIISCICQLVESYLVQLASCIDAQDKKSVAAIANCRMITTDLVPRVRALAQATLNQEILEISKLSRVTSGLHLLLADGYAAARAPSVLEVVLHWGTPSQSFPRMWGFFAQLEAYLAEILFDKDLAREVIKKVVVEVFVAMAREGEGGVDAIPAQEREAAHARFGIDLAKVFKAN